MTIFIIVVGTSCSLNSSYYNTISVEETEKNFYEYIDNLSDYNNSDVITEWNFKGRKGFINYSLYNGDTLLFLIYIIKFLMNYRHPQKVLIKVMKNTD